MRRRLRRARRMSLYRHTGAVTPLHCASRERRRSYLHGHSGFSRASSRHSGGKGRRERATLIPDTILPVWSGEQSIRSSQAVSSRCTGVRGSRWSEGGLLSVIRRPRRLRGTCYRRPIGSPPRGLAVGRPRVRPGRLEPRLPCRNTSRQASVREMPNGEAPDCVAGRRTRLVAGLW